MRSLSVERQRWETGSNAFQTQMGTIVGDVLLSSAFLAYAGIVELMAPFLYCHSVTKYFVRTLQIKRVPYSYYRGVHYGKQCLVPKFTDLADRTRQ